MKKLIAQKICIGVADTMFARGDMGGLAVKTLREYAKQLGKEKQVEVVRVTVPGFKDLAAACVRLFEKDKCAIAIALGMVGGEAIDEACAMVADIGLQYAQVHAGKHIVGVMVYSNEAKRKDGSIDDAKLAQIMRHRTIEHAKNALDLVLQPENLSKKAGTGQRQGGKNAGFVRL